MILFYLNSFRFINLYNRLDNDISHLVKVTDVNILRKNIIENKSDILIIEVDNSKKYSSLVKNILKYKKMSIILIGNKLDDVSISKYYLSGVKAVLNNKDDLYNKLICNLKKIKGIDFKTKNNLKKRLIAIGSSTGGTEALVNIISNLKTDMPPIIIAQHMPPIFTKSFADRLDSLSKLNVVEAQEGDVLTKNTVYIAPGKHMLVYLKNSRPTLSIIDSVKDQLYTPSVDILFNSLNKVFNCKHVLGIILTGMGKDGSKGLKTLKDNGATTITQEKKSCVIYGMPKEAVDIGASMYSMNLKEIYTYLNNYGRISNY